jgi:hypothetical protein
LVFLPWRSFSILAKAGLCVELANQARAAELVSVELGLQGDLELGQRALRLLVEQPDRVTDPDRGARVPRLASVPTRLGHQAQIAVFAERV